MIFKLYSISKVIRFNIAPKIEYKLKKCDLTLFIK